MEHKPSSTGRHTLSHTHMGSLFRQGVSNNTRQHTAPRHSTVQEMPCVESVFGLSCGNDAVEYFSVFEVMMETKRTCWHHMGTQLQRFASLYFLFLHPHYSLASQATRAAVRAWSPANVWRIEHGRGRNRTKYAYARRGTVRFWDHTWTQQRGKDRQAPHV